MLKKMLFILCLCFLIQSNVFAAEYIADGTGPTEKAAIQDSFRNALENVIGILIDSKTYARNNKIISDQIFSHTDGYVRGYTLLKKSMDGDNYIVRTKVIIDTDPNSALMTRLEKLQAIKIGINDPRIGILIINENGYNKNTDSSSEEAIISSLNKSGFSHVIDINQLKQVQAERFKLAAFNGDYATIAMLGTQEQLDYIITGTIKANHADLTIRTQQVAVESSRAILDVKTMKCDTAEVIQSGQFQESGVDVALENSMAAAKFKTGQAAGNAISNKLINYAATTSKNFTVYVHGIKDQTRLQGFEAYLRNTIGIQDVYIRNFINSSAVIDISFDGDSQTLASYLNQNENFPADISRITNNTIDLIVK